ncbi:MAG: hypothetical protein AB7E80_06180 [Hyphomicrobiaceae bacterium]
MNDDDDEPVSGAISSFYAADTTNPMAVWANESLETSLRNE